MANFKQYTMDEVWRPPHGDGERFAPTGCPFMDALCREIRASGYKPAGVVAARLGLTVRAFSGAVETLTGMGGKAWVDRWTMRDAEWLLLHTRLTIGEITHRMGYASTSNFSQAIRRRHKLSPTEYRYRNSTVRKHLSYEFIVTGEK